MNYYIIGDIHGCLSKLQNIYSKIQNIIKDEDMIIFLGDYIDRGMDSYKVIEFLMSLSEKHNTVFLKGNHESMLLEYINGDVDTDLFYYNGGDKTVVSYKKQFGVFRIPEKHLDFFNSLSLYYEGSNFIAVHAGLNPKIDNIEAQSEDEILWIRDQFFRADKKWEKTVIFGHTPTIYISEKKIGVYYDEARNIIGIDTGAVYGGMLTCLRWPDKTEFKS